MSSRSLNKVTLIGNLTRDPELRYTPQGTAVCTIGMATNRSWTTDSGEKREETEFHRLVSWNKLAELCAQLLTKGRKIYIEGRLQTRSWVGQDGAQRTVTEIVIDDMILLDRKPILGAPVPVTSGIATATTTSEPAKVPPVVPVVNVVSKEPEPVAEPVKEEIKEEKKTETVENVNADDIPF